MAASRFDADATPLSPVSPNFLDDVAAESMSGDFQE
jgi:hypothetical protein